MINGSDECNIFVLNLLLIKQKISSACSKAFGHMETRVLTLFDDEFFPPEPPKEKQKKEKPSKADPLPSDETIVPEEAPSKNVEPAAEPISEAIHLNIELPSAPTVTDSQHETKEPESDKEEVTNASLSEIETISEDNTVTAAPTVAIADSDNAIENVTPRDQTDADERVLQDEEPIEQAPFIEATEEAKQVEATEELPIEGRETEEEISDPSQDLQEPTPAPAEQEATIDTSTEPIEKEIETTQMEDVTDQTVAETTVHTEADKALNKQLLSELIQLDYTALMQKDYSFDLNTASVISKELPKKATPVPEPVKEQVEEEEPEEIFEDVTPLPEWNLDKKYYTIGEVAQLFEVNTSHIRFWTNEFKLKPRTTRKGDRLYSPKDIAELRLIHHLVKVKKHTIKGAREKLKSEKSDVNNKLDLKESLIQLKDTLLKIRAQL